MPEQSNHTSIKQRIQHALQETQSDGPATQPAALLPFAGNPREEMPAGIPFNLNDYLALVDWTGRILCDDKKGAIPDQLPAILQRLNMDGRHWLYLSRNFEHPFRHLVGAAHQVRAVCKELGKKTGLMVSEPVSSCFPVASTQ